MRRHALLLGILTLLVAMAVSCDRFREVKRIGVLNWSEDLVGYTQAYQGILDGLHANGYREGFNLTIDYEQAHGNDAEAKRILDAFVRERVDVVVTIGSAACLAAVIALEGTKIPLVFSVVGEPQASGIIDAWASPGRDVTGVAIDIPVQITFGKLKRVLPAARRVGIVYSDRYATAAAAAQHAEKIALREGFTAHLIPVGDEGIEKIEALPGAERGAIDVVYFTADPIFYSDRMMQRALPAFAAAGIPAMLISANYLKYGALLSVGCNFYDIGRQTVPHLIKVMSGIAAEDVPSERPYDYTFVINKSAARKLGITLSWNALIDADAITE
jgi:putative tryptophan/tyrosine transport system substrate-binding protein